MGKEEAAFPSLVARYFSPDVRHDAERFLAGGRVEEPSFFRLGIGGRLVARNGRVFPVLLAINREGRILGASCSCIAKQLPSRLCMHLAALVLWVSRPRGTGDGVALPGERFEKSLWFRAAEELHDQRVLEALGSTTGRVEPLDAPSALAFGPYEKRLAELTQTPEEAIFVKSGTKTQRQALEASKTFLVAKRAFEAVGEDPSRITVEVDDGFLRLVALGTDPPLRLPLSASVVDWLLREPPGFVAELGLRVEGAVREALRIELDRDAGSLLFEPVYLEDGDGEQPLVRSRSGSGAIRYGRHLFFPESRSFALLCPPRRPFIERSAPDQGRFTFDDAWQPSPLGVPLDRPTRIPAVEVAPFLTRHRKEIANLPSLLLPKELRGGGLARPDGAVLTVEGETAGRFLLSLEYLIEGQSVPLGPIAAARKKREPLLVIAGRALDPQDGRFGWIDLLAKDSLSGKGNSARLTLRALEICRLRSYLPVGHILRAAPGIPVSSLELLESLSPDFPAPPPEESGVALYDFQRTGYAWLWFLYRGGFGGLLCDDMGLGKTHQAIALLAALSAAERGDGVERPVLIVAPASVLPHWEEKLQRFLPGVPVVRNSGGDRKGKPAGRGITLTSYGVLRNDAAAFGETLFDLFLLDEIQTIKNRDTETHKALRSIEARIAIGLTGTPVENRVEELHTLLDFVLPGYLPPLGTFCESFVRPIEQGDEEARERLRRLTRPFVLRRIKAQVAIGLPEKVDDLRSCEMTPGQSKIYHEILSAQGAPLAQTLEGTGPVSRLHVFALLDKLKRVCDHPDLGFPHSAAPTGETSGKWELFTEIVDEALGSGLKVVVFSQYLRMLDRIEMHLSSIGAGWAGLRGATTDRAAPVARFHSDPSCRVFVSSLKAGGLGIDLTPASVVIHYDRWWNKAREDQATDRVHRIGQRRGVQVVTLVTRDSIEERIDRLIARKARLAADLVPEEDPGILRQFTREELRDLLRP